MKRQPILFILIAAGALCLSVPGLLSTLPEPAEAQTEATPQQPTLAQLACARGDRLMARALHAQKFDVDVDGVLQTVKTVMGEIGCSSPAKTCSVVFEAVATALRTDAVAPETRRAVVGLYRELDCSLATLQTVNAPACETLTSHLESRITGQRPFPEQVLLLADLQQLHCPLLPILDAADNSLTDLTTPTDRNQTKERTQ